MNEFIQIFWLYTNEVGTLTKITERPLNWERAIFATSGPHGMLKTERHYILK